MLKLISYIKAILLLWLCCYEGNILTFKYTANAAWLNILHKLGTTCSVDISEITITQMFTITFMEELNLSGTYFIVNAEL